MGVLFTVSSREGTEGKERDGRQERGMVFGARFSEAFSLGFECNSEGVQYLSSLARGFREECGLRHFLVSLMRPRPKTETQDPLS